MNLCRDVFLPDFGFRLYAGKFCNINWMSSVIFLQDLDSEQNIGIEYRDSQMEKNIK